MYLIVGLGNPGKAYENTRHNMGFLAIDRIAKQLGIDVTKNHCQALTGTGELNGHKIILAKPLTFMNLSGESIRELKAWHKIDISKVIVIYDDLDLDIGTISIKPKGSSGGHNGMNSIIQSLGSNEFSRIRIGIGRDVPGGDNAKYVLLKVPTVEMRTLEASLVNAADSALKIVTDGLDRAMNEFNK